MSNIQHFDWGKIDWIYEPSLDSSNIISIGIATIFPGKKQLKHIHYGNEQVLYGLSGMGEQIIEGESKIMEPGSIFYITSGSSHETINSGEQPLVELMISMPRQLNNNVHSQVSMIDESSLSIISTDGIIEFLDKLTYNIKAQMSFYTMDGDLIYDMKKYPSHCIDKCGINNNIKNCHLYNDSMEYMPYEYNEGCAYICKYGLTVYDVPIKSNNKVYGMIRGGHLRERNTTAYSEVMSNNVYATPKSTVNALLELMKLTGDKIIDFCSIKSTELQFNKKDEIINDIIQNEMQLEESLENVTNKMLNLRINNHFLFNTLNAIASLAIKENSPQIYEAIINLAKMFRYSLKNNQQLIEFREEISYLKNYLHLQKLRYGDKIRIEFFTSFEVESVLVPFNFIQTIVENCFVHGFNGVDEIGIIIKARIIDKTILSIEVKDDGAGMSDNKLRELNNIILNRDLDSNGLNMVVNKLSKYYGDDLSFKISSKIGDGTSIQISVPLKPV